MNLFDKRNFLILIFYHFNIIYHFSSASTCPQRIWEIWDRGYIQKTKTKKLRNLFYSLPTKFSWRSNTSYDGKNLFWKSPKKVPIVPSRVGEIFPFFNIVGCFDFFFIIIIFWFMILRDWVPCFWKLPIGKFTNW